MPFNAVSEETDSKGGNFSTAARQFYNRCGASHYNGQIRFKDASHRERSIPIFHQDCLSDIKDHEKPETTSLVTLTRQAMRGSRGANPYASLGVHGRSIHQNTAGNLPYMAPENATKKNPYEFSGGQVASPALYSMATAHGELPANQSGKGEMTRGEFLELTCGDKMDAYARLVIDYRFGIIYITLGHYHPDSFALLIRSEVELSFEIEPTLPVLKATYAA